MFLKSIFISFFISLGFCSAGANEVIFNCQSQHSVFNPDYVQGSEVYADILYNTETKNASIELDPPSSSKLTILNERENTKVSFTIENSAIYLEWVINDEQTYMSLVYLGSYSWGSALYLNSPMLSRAPSLNNQSHIELLCTETLFFKELIKTNEI